MRDEAETMDRPLTFGQRAVGLTFNPGNREDVDQCKSGFAIEIDRMNELRDQAQADGDNEKARLAATAITHLQTAQMWAVKAITWDSNPR